MDLEASLLKLLRKTFVLKIDAFADRFESNHYIYLIRTNYLRDK